MKKTLSNLAADLLNRVWSCFSSYLAQSEKKNKLDKILKKNIFHVIIMGQRGQNCIHAQWI